MIMPLGTYITPKRLIGLAADVCSADSAGIMLSSSGSASIEPSPRSTVRRGIAIFEMIIASLSYRRSGDQESVIRRVGLLRRPTGANGRIAKNEQNQIVRQVRFLRSDPLARVAKATPVESRPRSSPHFLLLSCSPVVLSVS